MANEHIFQAAEGAMWVQINGPNTAPVYLGCHEIGDVDESEGDITLIRCPDPKRQGAFVTRGSFQGAPSPATFTITTGITEDIDELERAKCPFPLFIHKSRNGARDRFTNFTRTVVFVESRITSRGMSGLLVRSEDNNGPSEQTFDVSAQEVMRLVAQDINRQSSVTETENINDISFCGEQSCRTSDEPAQEACDVGYAVADAAGAATATVLRTTDGGGTWAATAADPFAADEHVSAVECVEIDNETTRVIVARGTTDASNPAEIAYSDDSGATWTTVDLGTTVALFVPNAHSLFALDASNIWVGTDAGTIFYSSDGGVIWTEVESASIHSGAWNAIEFTDEDVGWAGGDANVIARTLDGGTTWTQITGPGDQSAAAVTSLAVIDRNRVWLGYDDGEIWFTMDGGDTWEQRSFSGSGTGSVNDVKFFNEMLGYIAKDSAAPSGTVLWTVNGGYSWQALATETNAGYNALAICDVWNFFVVGNTQGGTGYIAKGTV